MTFPPPAPLRRSPALWLAVATLLLALTLVAAILLGTEPVSLARAVAGPGLDRNILLHVRPPRVALAALAGAGLAIVGTAFQALLRNPLAEPYVLGVSGGAALGATIPIALGIGATTLLGAALLPATALAGGIAATLLVYAIARDTPGQATGTSILLAGIMVNAIASALITFLKTLVPPSRAQQLLRWLVGFIDLPSPAALAFVALYIVVGSAVLLRDAGRLNLLALGDEAAESLGLDVRTLTRRVFFACSCIVGAIVSVTGLIGFVGLLVPHTLRRLLGPDHRQLLPLSLLTGATLLTACDLLARVLFRWLGTELPVGAVTALLGGPLFLMLLRRSAL
ncbi:FecCD family ABC transporter permease [Chondromyces apiculatus]|uniref:Vitamin B12 ABC transporter, permease component BtuC n=1 Tax=Chondromyces apiculatus DSM 436 TaxID=1192034 RepID=A0A017TFS0_9BACT|nr:iron ABC transporter permease [Chondromyces apiculatus]EYF08128.1 Vitamin B12 ABC transporter, permease component BtuC [Chondromyces apiculatus DSM 436]